MDDSEFIESLETVRCYFNEIILLYKHFSQNLYPYRSMEDRPLNKVTELIQASKEIVDKIENKRLLDVSNNPQKRVPVS